MDKTDEILQELHTQIRYLYNLARKDPTFTTTSLTARALQNMENALNALINENRDTTIILRNLEQTGNELVKVTDAFRIGEAKERDTLLALLKKDDEVLSLLTDARTRMTAMQNYVMYIYSAAKDGRTADVLRGTSAVAELASMISKVFGSLQQITFSEQQGLTTCVAELKEELLTFGRRADIYNAQLQKLKKA